MAVMTSKAEEYRCNARECEQLAEQSRDARLKEQFLKIARQWRDLADRPLDWRPLFQLVHVRKKHRPRAVQTTGRGLLPLLNGHFVRCL
jgi:hypothetical protein